MSDRIKKAIEVAVQFGGIDGDHHKAWVIDQMVRALTGCPMVEEVFPKNEGGTFTYKVQGASGEYTDLIAAACDGEDGPETYEWNTGISP